MKKSPSKANGHKALALLSTVPVGALVAQPHGGALRNGGSNTGGGSLPKVVRELSLRAFKKVGLATLVQVATDKTVDPTARITAAASLGKFGFGSESGAQQGSASIETPDGFKFSLTLGEREAE